MGRSVFLLNAPHHETAFNLKVSYSSYLVDNAVEYWVYCWLFKDRFIICLTWFGHNLMLRLTYLLSKGDRMLRVIPSTLTPPT